jgi:3-dehydroquinate synthase
LIRIEIQTRSKSYEVLIEQGLLRSAGRHWGKLLLDSFASDGARVDVIEMADGEQSKTLATVEGLAGELVKLKADRNTILVALGGGVVGDVTGFLASIYMRGIRFVQVPTTFLSQVDSSVGGKTGVNLAAGKNLVGSFKQPELVLVDPHVLSTLPEREYRSGLYESLKSGVIRNPQIFEFMEHNREKILAKHPGSLEWLIAESVRVKAEVVGQDEEERGLRKILNFGHTIGHALEGETGYKVFLHGEAVAWGMVAATMIAMEMDRIPRSTAQRIIDLVLAYGPLPKVDVRPKEIFRRLGSDKKTLDGLIHFVLPSDVGKVEIVTDVREEVVMRVVEELRGLPQG